ncbi:MAG: hypothetical protein DRQ40_03190 [Gammaproteobacteria bacterium]|nr:MAG: hypothetical protein DRQ40_03190 [Gammaproteobacteria bacterium]
MSESHFNRIYLTCPIIYRGRHDDLKKSLMSFGFCCGEGWFILINELSQQVEAIAVDMKNRGCLENELPIVVQVKEKFGGLRFYMRHQNDEISSLIEEAEAKSYRICERCGLLGKLMKDDGWYRTECVSCRAKLKE